MYNIEIEEKVGQILFHIIFFLHNIVYDLMLIFFFFIYSFRSELCIVYREKYQSRHVCIVITSYFRRAKSPNHTKIPINLYTPNRLDWSIVWVLVGAEPHKCWVFFSHRFGCKPKLTVWHLSGGLRHPAAFFAGLCGDISEVFVEQRLSRFFLRCAHAQFPNLLDLEVE
jgi:hypothetical protein